MKKVFTILALFICFPMFGQTSYTVYVFLAEECPVCNYIGKTLKKVSEEYDAEFKFVAVFPQKLSNYKTSSVFKKKYGLNGFLIELDHDLEITNKYNASITPEVVVVDKEDNILYRGRVNNSYASPGRMRHGKVTEDLKMALMDITKGKKIAKPWPDPIGCYITK